MKTLKRAVSAGVVVLMTWAAHPSGGSGWPEPVEGHDVHPTFTVGTAMAQRGEKAYGVLNVPAGSDAGYDIPVTVIHGARPGPVLAVVSGAHGTEYASIIAVETLADAVNPADLSGTLVPVPLVNVPSFDRIVSHVNPTDNKSMNSRYPGDPNGTQTDRASYVITKAGVEPCEHLIDLHGGDLDENLRPHSYWTVTGNQQQDEASRAMVPAPVANPVWIEKIVTVAAEQSGVFFPQVTRDAHVLKGNRIGLVKDHWGRTIAQIEAPESGIIMFVRAVPSSKKGDTLANIGVVKA